jgi:hypothetical protein
MALWKPSYHVKNLHSNPFDPEQFKKELGMSWETLPEDTNQTVEELKRYASIHMSSGEILDFFSHVAHLSMTYSTTGEDYLEVYKDTDLQEPKHPVIVGKLMEAMHSAPGQSLPGRKMTLWGAINAVTYWTDHMRGGDANRGIAVVNGSADNYKLSALSLAREMTRVFC